MELKIFFGPVLTAVRAATRTIATSAMIKAYSTIPWPAGRRSQSFSSAICQTALV